MTARELVVFTYVGLAAGLVHMLLPGEHHVGPVSSFAVGWASAWGGALFGSAFVQGGWASFGLLSLAGTGGCAFGACARCASGRRLRRHGKKGAVGSILALELAADAYFRREGPA